MAWPLPKPDPAHRRLRNPLRCIALAACLVGLVSPAAPAQPLELQLDEYPVTVEYYPGGDKVARKVLSICRGAIPELAAELGLEAIGSFRVLLITDMAGFQERQGIRLPSWGIAFALMDNQIMLVDVKRANSAWNSLEKVIAHELSHLLVAQRVGAVRMPVWFVEGLAVWQAREWSLLEGWRLMESVWTGSAPGLGQLISSLPAEEGRVRAAYRVAYSGFVDRFQQEMNELPAFLAMVEGEGDFSVAFERRWQENEYLYYARFDQALYRKYHSKLLFFQTGPLFSVIAVLFLFVVLWIKLRNRRKLKRLEQAEQGITREGWERS